MLKLHHLRDFVAIAEARSVRGAARALGLAQPALTRSLRELERHLGVQLLERHARGVVTTAEGDRFVLRARAALEEVRRGQEEARQFAGDMHGHVTAALSSAAILALLPAAFPQFRRECPGVRLRLLEGAFPTVEKRLRDASVDFYVGPRPQGVDRQAFRIETLFANERRIVVRQGHPLRHVRSLRALTDADWVLTGLHARTEQELEEQFEAYGIPPPRMPTLVDSLLGLLTLLTTTDAVALLPRQCVDSPMFRGAVCAVPIRESLAAPDIVAVMRSGMPLTPAADLFLTLLGRANRPVASRASRM